MSYHKLFEALVPGAGIVLTDTSVTPGVVRTLISVVGGGSVSGIWTPGLVSSLGGNITLTTATAKYTKSGNLVTCFYDFVIATETGGGNNGLITLTGLPFMSASGTGVQGSLNTSYFALLDADQTAVTGTVPPSTTTVLLWSVHQAKIMTRLMQSDIKPTTQLVGLINYFSI